MEILFFLFAFVFLFLYEQTRAIQPAQWIKVEVLPEVQIDWERYDIPTFQRCESAPTKVGKKQKAATSKSKKVVAA